MKSVIPFNVQYLSMPFGLENTGVLCYFNSLLQALATCTSFTEYFLESTRDLTENKLAMAYLEYVRKFIQTNGVALYNAKPVLLELNVLRKDKQYNLTPGLQEDVHEGLTLFLDSLPQDVNKLFHIRYKCEIICINCKTRKWVETDSYKEPAELVIDLSDKKKLYTQEQVEKHILRYVQLPDDYTCEFCKAKNDSTNAKIFQVYYLVKISSIFTIMFKKYKMKEDKYFPPCLNFMTEKGLMSYVAIAKIEHTGVESFGHYTCDCIRSTPRTLYEEKIKALEIKINHFKNLNYYDSIHQVHKFKEDIANYVKLLNIPHANIFKIDDCKIDPITPTTEEKYHISQTRDTYMVFYHLVNIGPPT